jgi:O-methyltransferase involved in polyketide biosynthesis
MPKDYSSISPTAVMVAALRARYTGMPYAREIYRAVRPVNRPVLLTKVTHTLSDLAKFAQHSMSRVAFLESRYLSVNGVLKSLDEDYAVIEVASGLSPRGLEWAGRNTTYIETDLPDMLDIKQQVFAKILLEKGLLQAINHHFFSLNALDYQGWERLGDQFFKDGRSKIAVIHEGLASYLSREEKEILRDNIMRFFQQYASSGIWITPDFYPYDVTRRTFISRLVQARLEERTKTRMHHFSGPPEVLEFISQGGFQASSCDSSFIFDQVTCISKIPLDREKARSALSRYLVYMGRYEHCIQH